MLADSRSTAFVSNFAGQWLHLRNLRGIIPNSDLFPDFDDNLRQAFQREAELFFESVLRENRSVLDLMTADYTFVNERLARHYGIREVFGSDFRRVQLKDPARHGLLGKGAVLLATSHPTTTSPVLRGKWVLENIVGTPPPAPPANLDTALKTDPPGSAPRTMRAQMERHRTNPVCASCHQTMDPIGFALENFDVVGKWRTEDQAGLLLDTSDVLTDGSTISGVVSLRQALVKRPRRVRADVHRETARLCTGPWPYRRGHAGGSKDRARRGTTAVSFHSAVARDCGERALSNASQSSGSTEAVHSWRPTCS